MTDTTIATIDPPVTPPAAPPTDETEPAAPEVAGQSARRAIDTASSASPWALPQLMGDLLIDWVFERDSVLNELFEALPRDSHSESESHLLDQVGLFVDAVDRAGARIFAPDDRLKIQRILDYWSSVLVRAGRGAVRRRLQAFDISSAPDLPDSLRPYTGLGALDESDAENLYGRDKDITRIVDLLNGEKRLAILLGPSGSGKSSVIRAGVVPMLRKSGTRIIGPIMLGTRPAHALAFAVAGDIAEALEQALQKDPRALAGALLDRDTADRSCVVIIDQMEELFTLADGDARAPVLATILDLARRPDIRLLLSMRDDFYPLLKRLPAWSALLEPCEVRLAPPDEDSLRKAIEAPAAKVGLQFEADIVDDLVHEVRDERTPLPLMQCTLFALWQARKRNLITRAAYDELGGPRNALGVVADRTLQKLPQEARDIARLIFLKLVQINDNEEFTSRRVPLSEVLALADQSLVRQALSAFQDQMLIRVTSQSTSGDERTQEVSVAHEFLIRNWPQFREWINESRDDIRERSRIGAAAKSWVTRGRDSSLLLRGPALERAVKFIDADSAGVGLTGIEQEFIKASQNSGRRRKFIFSVVPSVLLAVPAGIFYGIEHSRRQKLEELNADLVKAQGQLQDSEKVLKEKVNELNDANKLLNDQKRLAEQNLERLKSQSELSGEQPPPDADVSWRQGISLENGTLAAARIPASWSRVKERAASIETCARAVCRILQSDGTTYAQVATGFLLGPTAVVTAGYVSTTAERKSGKLFADFGDGRNFEQMFELSRRYDRFGSQRVGGWEFMSIHQILGDGRGLPTPLTAAAQDRYTKDRKIYVVGFPNQASLPQEVWDKRFPGESGIKRVMPGVMLREEFDAATRLTRLWFDSATAGGVGGGPIIDLESSQVLAIHFGGPTVTLDRNTEKYGYCLFETRNDPAVVSNKLLFSS